MKIFLKHKTTISCWCSVCSSSEKIVQLVDGVSKSPVCSDTGLSKGIVKLKPKAFLPKNQYSLLHSSIFFNSQVAFLHRALNFCLLGSFV